MKKQEKIICRNEKCNKVFEPKYHAQRYCCKKCKKAQIQRSYQRKYKLKILQIKRKKRTIRDLINLAQSCGRSVKIERGVGFKKIIFYPKIKYAFK